MRHAAIVLVTVSTLSSQAYAQTFTQCADVTGNGVVSSQDVVMEWNEHLGGLPIPFGVGDVDFREGYSIGDIQFLIGHLFRGWPEGGCPPIPLVPVLTGEDTVLLPTATVPPGSGTLSLPVILKSVNQVTDLLLPIRLSGLDATIFLDSIRAAAFADPSDKTELVRFDSTAVLLFSETSNSSILVPGLRRIATAYVRYAASPGGIITMDTTSRWPRTSLQYVYAAGDDPLPLAGYDHLTLGSPAIQIVNTVGLFPNLSAAPDTLYFEAIAGYPDPDSQSFQVQSDGAPFSWSIITPWWVDVDKTSGVSGDWVTVLPHTSTLNIQTHRDHILIVANGALESPFKVTVEAVVRPAYPAMDANCDGVQSAADIIMLVNYIFKSGVLPCNPCTGQTGGGN